MNEQEKLNWLLVYCDKKSDEHFERGSKTSNSSIRATHDKVASTYAEVAGLIKELMQK